MIKKKQAFVDKAYKLTQNKAPLSFMIPSRNTKRKALLYFDESTGQNRSLRYARNQKSPFEDEQDDNVILEPIIFEDGMLFVRKQEQALQKFLEYHPGNGYLYVEIDNEKDATTDVETLDFELEAQILAKDLDLEMLETIGRVVIGLNVDKLTSSELKRDVRMFAKKYSREFIESVNDPLLKLQNSCSKLFSENILVLKNKKDVYYNLKGNKNKLLTVPYGEDPLFILASFFQSDEGLEVHRLLESKIV
jgi:DNA-dependent RNA polymerase auxiliary subunit epsilon